MNQYIDRLPEHQKNFIKNLVESHGYTFSPGSFMVDVPLAKTPDERHILTVTYTEGVGHIIMGKRESFALGNNFVEPLPIMDEQKMKHLVR